MRPWPWSCGIKALALRRAQRTGRPLGDQAFLLALEEKLGRRLRRRKPGPQGQGEAA